MENNNGIERMKCKSKNIRIYENKSDMKAHRTNCGMGKNEEQIKVYMYIMNRIGEVIVMAIAVPVPNKYNKHHRVCNYFINIISIVNGAFACNELLVDCKKHFAF